MTKKQKYNEAAAILADVARKIERVMTMLPSDGNGKTLNSVLYDARYGVLVVSSNLKVKGK